MYPANYWKKQEGHWFGSKYLLREFLGCGAFGAVFRADEMLADRVMQSVAIKIVIADLDNLDNQLAELQLSVRLRHPNLINGITCEQGEIFGDLCLGLVMELADETLESYYAKHPQGLSVETVSTITQHLGRGLIALHQDGVIHRDLKPANVLLVKDVWKLGDFGIARSLQGKTSTYTSPSQQIGTVAYMPPEAYSGKISPAWDLWALGVMVHELATGQHPFPTQLVPELMRMVLMEDPQIDPKIPSPLQEIVAGCLIKEPKQRWSTEKVLGALKSSPSGKDAVAYYNRGVTLGELGKYEEAIQNYNQAIALDPQYTYAYDNRGVNLEALGKYEEAIQDYSQALALNPQHTYAYYNRGVALVKLGKYEEAIENYNQALALDPQFTNVYYNRGLALCNLGKYEEAIENYNQALVLDPQSSDFHYHRGWAFEVLGKYEEAIENYNQALVLDPQSSDSYYSRGNALFASKKYEEAIQNYNQALALDPQFTDVYYNRGNALGILGRYEEAIENYNQVLALDPQNTKAYYNRGVALEKLNRAN